jgi:hypothetical protein
MRQIFKTLVSVPSVVNVLPVPSKHSTTCRDDMVAVEDLRGKAGGTCAYMMHFTDIMTEL